MSEPDPQAGPEAGLESGHRLSPFGLLLSFVTGLPQLLFPAAAALYGARSADIGTSAIVGGVLLVGFGFRWLAWLRFRYIVGSDEIRIEQGLINRLARSIPYDRIQDVSVEHGLLARLLGLAVVRFDTGGGQGEEASLAYVSQSEADRLRDLVRARQGGGEGQLDGAAQPARAGPDPLYAMDWRRLLVLGFYSFSLVIFAVLGGAAQQLDFLLPFGWDDLGFLWSAAESRSADLTRSGPAAQLASAALVIALLGVIGVTTGVVRTVLVQYGFRLDRTARGFRRRRGLFSRSDVVIPAERVQAAMIGTGPLRKRRGWYALHFIGLSGEGGENGNHEMAPLARLDEVWQIAREAGLSEPAPDLSFVRAASGAWLDARLLVVAGAALAGGAVWTFSGLITGGDAGPVAAVVAAAVAGFASLLLWLAAGWLGWRRTMHAIDAAQIYARYNWWSQHVLVACQRSAHVVTIVEGPLQRRRGLADVWFGIAGAALVFRAVPLERARAIRAKVLSIAAPIDFSEL